MSRRALPCVTGSAAAGCTGRKGVQRYGADGQRERYFADDDNVDLATLVKRVKYGDDLQDLDNVASRNIMDNAG